MFAAIREWWQSRERPPMVRPWGLAAPILVLVVCLPLLRPLRHPTSISDNEQSRLATIEAIVEKRTLAVAAVFGSGLVSYATVLNSHALAAFFVLGACGCFFHAGLTKQVVRSYAWLGLAGLCAALAATIDMAAVAYLVLLIGIILAMRWPASSRLSGLIWYIAGAVGPIVLHAWLTVPITGDIRPGFLHAELDPSSHETVLDSDDGDQLTYGETVALHLADGLLGPHGLLSHFPIVLFGLAGIGAVLHRHWPLPTKVLAMTSLLAALAIVIAYVTMGANWEQPMFSVRWFIVFMPLLVYWCG